MKLEARMFGIRDLGPDPEHEGWHMSEEIWGYYQDEADAAIRELVEAGRRALGAVGYEGQLHEHDALHELNALIAKYEEEA